LAEGELSFPLMPLGKKKTTQIIVDSENNYLGAFERESIRLA
jgi:uncharacterized protein (DUF3820 family)